MGVLIAGKLPASTISDYLLQIKAHISEISKRLCISSLGEVDFIVNKIYILSEISFYYDVADGENISDYGCQYPDSWPVIQLRMLHKTNGEAYAYAQWDRGVPISTLKRSFLSVRIKTLLAPYLP